MMRLSGEVSQAALDLIPSPDTSRRHAVRKHLVEETDIEKKSKQLSGVVRSFIGKSRSRCQDKGTAELCF
jgi:hypothetical protein